ncbi:MarR family winged helix-turn-helix transcriptional regulator [Paramylibacter ulvae]|nr:MarR family transcriptional regulator [Amylibacter ulvae]
MSNAKRYNLQTGFGYRFTIIGQTNSRRLEAELHKLGLTRMKWCVLVAVGEEKLHQPSQIAEFIGINRTAASRTLRQMEAEGLIVRTGGLGDKRSTNVTLTDKAQGILNQAIPRVAFIGKWFREKLSPVELEQLENILNKLLDGEERGFSQL